MIVGGGLKSVIFSFFFFKQKTAYEIGTGDWSSDVCLPISGAGFPVYKGKGAKLQRALIAYFLDKNTEAGYTEDRKSVV